MTFNRTSDHVALPRAQGSNQRQVMSMSPRRLLAVTLAGVAIAVSGLTAASAATVLTRARPLAPAVGYASYYNSYLLVWAEDRGTGTGLDLYGIRLTASGIPQGAEIPVVVASGNQSDPTLAFSQQVGEFLLMYTDDSGGPLTGLPTPGLPLPGTPSLPTPGGPAPATPPVAPPPPPLLAMANGPSLPMQPTAPPPGGTATPVTATATAGPPPVSSGSRDIYGIFVTASGQATSNSFPVVNSPADETYPDLSYMPRGGRGDRIGLVWREVNGVNAAISVMEITPIGRNFVINTKNSVVSGGDLGRPSIAAEVPSGAYLVVWSQTPTGDSTRDIFARRLNANAFPYGAPLKIEGSLAPVDDVYPSLASLEDYGGFVVAWERRDGASAPDIQTRRLNKNGIPYRSDYSLAGGPPFSFAPDVASSSSDTTLVVWIDRNAASDHSIMASAVNRTGQRRGPEIVVVQGGAGPGPLTPIAPNPGGPTAPAPPPPPIP